MTKRRSRILQSTIETAQRSIKSLENTITNAKISDQEFICFYIISYIKLPANMLVLLLLISIRNNKIISNLRPFRTHSSLIFLIISIQMRPKEGKSIRSRTRVSFFPFRNVFSKKSCSVKCQNLTSLESR